MRGAHQPTREAAQRRWKALGYSNDPALLPPFLKHLGLFSRVTGTRCLEGLVVLADPKIEILCSQLQALGATVVEGTYMICVRWIPY